MTDEHLHATVSARGIIVEPRGQILVLQRSTDNEWELPGGRLAPNEDPTAGLKRELKEETSLPVEVDEIVAANSWVNTDNKDRFAVHYRCYAPQMGVTLSDEHTEGRWVERSEIDTLLCESQTTAVRAATGFSAIQSKQVEH